MKYLLLERLLLQCLLLKNQLLLLYLLLQLCSLNIQARFGFLESSMWRDLNVRLCIGNLMRTLDLLLLHDSGLGFLSWLLQHEWVVDVHYLIPVVHEVPHIWHVKWTMLAFGWETHLLNVCGYFRCLCSRLDWRFQDHMLRVRLNLSGAHHLRLYQSLLCYLLLMRNRLGYKHLCWSWFLMSSGFLRSCR